MFKHWKRSGAGAIEVYKLKIVWRVATESVIPL
jgi:hypothetical protein